MKELAVELDRGRHAVPQLYELLRARITSLAWEPGTILSRAELAAQFGVSQTPVREALLKLAEEKLVDVFPQSATRVSHIDMAYAREAHFLRRALELEIVRDLAQARPRGLVAQLRSGLALQESLRQEGDFDGFSQADQDFHHALYLFADRASLWLLVRSRSGHIDRLRRLHLPAAGKQARILKDHRQIVDAIEAGDTDAAQAALRKHLSGTLESAESIRETYPAFFTAR